MSTVPRFPVRRLSDHKPVHAAFTLQLFPAPHMTANSLATGFPQVRAQFGHVWSSG